MTRRDKLRVRLDELEQRLIDELLPALDKASVDGWLGIFSWVQSSERSALVEFIYSRASRPHAADLVEEIEALRAKLGETTERTVAAWYRDACRACLDVTDHNRLGPRRLAADLAARIRSIKRAGVE